MEKSGGIYKIPCEVNGLRMKFYFDTGASLVSISLKEAMFMLENGYLSKSDIIGTGKSSIADGSIVENTIINLREMKIGSKKLQNVRASVSNSLMAPILLGQSALKRLGEYKVQDDFLILTAPQKTAIDVDAVREKAYNSYKDGISLVAESEYEKLEQTGYATSMDLLRYGTCCLETGNAEKAIRILSETKDVELSDSARLQKYQVIASAYGTIGNEYYCKLHDQNAYLIFKDKKESFAGRTALLRYYFDNKEFLKARDLCNGLLNEYIGNSYDNLSGYYGGKDELLDYMIAFKYQILSLLAYESQNFDYYQTTLKNIIELSKKNNKSAKELVEGMRIREVFHPCTYCSGTGRCTLCEGSGKKSYGTCISCDGTGSCRYCFGKRGINVVEHY
ncbi:MAG: retroviral-like aspartic protease family protein [Prevotella sp.]|nr:retroviral-like aspartic protease family protein [Prevotella sp.]